MNPDKRTFNRCTREHALACAQYLRAYYPVGKIYVFGNVARYGYGADLNLIIETPFERFLSFQEECLLRGIPWVIGTANDSNDSYRGHFSRRMVRASAALQVLVPSRRTCHESAKVAQYADVPVDLLDIGCMPLEWTEDRGIQEWIRSELPGRYDRRFVEMLAAAEAVELIIA